MCGRFALAAAANQVAAARLAELAIGPADDRPRYNIAIGQTAPVALAQPETGRVALVSGLWGLARALAAPPPGPGPFGSIPACRP